MGNLVVKDNALIESSHKLNEIEQRLILLAIIKIREQYNSIEQAKNKEITIHADDYISVFNVERNAAYKALKQAVVGLYRAEWGYQTINKRGNVEVVYERFTQNAKYVTAEATVKFTFSNAIIPLLVELEKNFTSYQIEQVSNLSSRYAMRLFELLMQHFDKKKSKGWLEISLDDLRFRFGLNKDEYTRMGNFKDKVLNLSVTQINENTEYCVSYEQKKQGRIIKGFRFDIKTKTEAKPQKIKERDENTVD
ncbi:replication initiation protein RepM, partial [Moraxella catarrhalis]|uniref:replication initiation protein RepM n=1 Tax=Moraxella catarrhalis TaxID=480 RepID=UPI00128D8773